MSKAFLRAYIEAALFSTTDDQGEPLDKNYSRSDIDPETLARMKADCETFERDNTADLTHGTAEQGGHDFWLTRNGHGAGFWDGDWPDIPGQNLSKAAESMGVFDLYVGDDGKIYGA